MSRERRDAGTVTVELLVRQTIRAIDVKIAGTLGASGAIAALAWASGFESGRWVVPGVAAVVVAGLIAWRVRVRRSAVLGVLRNEPQRISSIVFERRMERPTLVIRAEGREKLRLRVPPGRVASVSGMLRLRCRNAVIVTSPGA
jgi:tRNA threonylcarbamoyladenosine modification (KEOPS) complex  Pcc1 subunit